MKDQLYFKNEDSEFCYGLQHHLDDAKDEELKTITLIEAYPDDSVDDMIFCKELGVTDKCECSKSKCEEYKSNSGRGKCEHKGKLYTYGEEVKFEVK